VQVPCDEGVGAAKLAALNLAYKEREKRGVIKLNLVSLALTGGAILALLVALGAIVVQYAPHRSQ
jgi:uncharacterized BrkB/YihY/UPF0761 family membrane protein